MESKSVFFYIFGLILLCIKTKYSKKRPFHDTCNSTIYNYWLHMKWTSNVVNPRVVVLLRVVAWRNTTSRGLKTGCWPYMNMNFLDNYPMNIPNQFGSNWNSALQRRWLKTDNNFVDTFHLLISFVCFRSTTNA